MLHVYVTIAEQSKTVEFLIYLPSYVLLLLCLTFALMTYYFITKSYKTKNVLQRH